MNRKRVVLILVGLAVLVLGVYVVVRSRGADEALLASGTVEATEAGLGFQVPGRIERVVPNEGDRGRAGAGRRPAGRRPGRCWGGCRPAPGARSWLKREKPLAPPTSGSRTPSGTSSGCSASCRVEPCRRRHTTRLHPAR